MSVKTIDRIHPEEMRKLLKNHENVLMMHETDLRELKKSLKELEIRVSILEKQKK